MIDSAYFVRHGSHSFDNLDEAGQEQASRVTETLMQLGLGRSALLLSSDIPRAVQTAEIINQSIGGRVLASHELAEASFVPNRIPDLEALLSRVAGSHGESLDEADGLVVVTHSPLVAYLKGPEADEDDIEFTEMVEYKMGSWIIKPSFTPRLKPKRSGKLFRRLFR